MYGCLEFKVVIVCVCQKLGLLVEVPAVVHQSTSVIGSNSTLNELINGGSSSKSYKRLVKFCDGSCKVVLMISEWWQLHKLNNIMGRASVKVITQFTNEVVQNWDS